MAPGEILRISTEEASPSTHEGSDESRLTSLFATRLLRRTFNGAHAAYQGGGVVRCFISESFFVFWALVVLLRVPRTMSECAVFVVFLIPSRQSDSVASGCAPSPSRRIHVLVFSWEVFVPALEVLDSSCPGVRAWWTVGNTDMLVSTVLGMHCNTYMPPHRPPYTLNMRLGSRLAVHALNISCFGLPLVVK